MAKKKSEARPDLLVTAFELIAEAGWRGLRLTEVARRADVPLADIYAAMPSRKALLRSLGERLDAAMLAIDLAELDELSPRERLFELMMRRFDAMAPFRPGLSRLARDARFDPCLLLSSFARLDRMAAWQLDVAGIKPRGLKARLARRGLMAVYARTFNVWLDDDSEDQARTLAELDRRLQDLERAASMVTRPQPRRRPEPPPAGEAAEAPA